MLTPARRLYTAKQSRILDREAQAALDISSFELMQQAAAAAWEQLCAHWQTAKNIIVCIGSGNNAGDGLVLASLAANAGCPVQIYALHASEKLSGDAHHALALAQQHSIPYQIWQEDLTFDSDVIVDAIFGSGLNRDLDEQTIAFITAINSSNLPVLALDIPSGLHADSGQMMPIAVKASVTVCFIGWKRGLFTGNAADVTGKRVYAAVDVPASVHHGITEATTTWMQLEDWASFFCARKKTAHKGDFGHVLVVGGTPGYAGATLLAANAALRCGAGLVSIATHPQHATTIGVNCPEVMVHGVANARQLSPLLQSASVILVGPGLGTQEWGKILLSTILESPLPLIVDADALNLLATEPCEHQQWILTPHPGEAARLLACTTAQIQADRYAAALQLQQQYHATIVLKGSGTLVVAEAFTGVCTAGNAGMASGGMGDVLGGVIAALVAQHMPLTEAAACGVCLHANAADHAAKMGARGMIASDLFTQLRSLVNP